jgi:hypothetical protein
VTVGTRWEWTAGPSVLHGWTLRAGRRLGHARLRAYRLRRSPTGAMAQLVAHLLCKQGVTGSSPVGSTPRQTYLIELGPDGESVRTAARYLPASRGIPRVELLAQSPERIVLDALTTAACTAD